MQTKTPAPECRGPASYFRRRGLDLAAGDRGGDADVIERRDAHDFRLHAVVNVERGHEGPEVVEAHRLPTRHILEDVVGTADAFAPEDDLDRLGDDLGVFPERLGHGLSIRGRLTETTHDRLVGDQAPAERDAEVAHHSGVREIALEARLGELAGEEFKQRVRELEVAFPILPVDRVDLVGHGRRSRLTRHSALRDPAVADVAPRILRQIFDDVVDADHHLEQLGIAVVRFDLRGVVVCHDNRIARREAAERRDEARCKLRPVHVRKRNELCVVVASGTGELGVYGNPVQLVELPFEAFLEHAHFLAERRWRRRLTVRACEHRKLRMLDREFLERVV